VHRKRVRAVAVLLTLQAGLVVYTGARVARAFMEQGPASEEARAFAPTQPLTDTAAPAAAAAAEPAATPSVRSFVYQEIVDPWQASRPVAHNAELVDPWREPRPLDTDPELIDPWRNERTLASAAIPVAEFDWNTSPPEPLNPWPTAVAPLSYDLNELIDPWAAQF
jgi:hypothetical protein